MFTKKCDPDQIGAGGFGIIVPIAKNSPYIMKIIRKPMFPKREAEYFCLYHNTETFPDFVGAYTCEGFDAIVMSRIDGYSLKEFFDGSRPTIATLDPVAQTRVFDEVEEKLPRLVGLVHEKGHIHGDIKFANIMLTFNKDGSINLTLVDLGSAAKIGTRYSSSVSPSTPGTSVIFNSKPYIRWKGWVPEERPAEPYAIKYKTELIPRTESGSNVVDPGFDGYAVERLLEELDNLRKRRYPHTLGALGVAAKRSRYLGPGLNWQAKRFPEIKLEPFLPLPKVPEEASASAAAAAPEARKASAADMNFRERGYSIPQASVSAAPASASRKAPASRRKSRNVSATAAQAPSSASAAPASASVAPVSAPAASASAVSGVKRSRRGGRRTRRKRRSRTRKVR